MGVWSRIRVNMKTNKVNWDYRRGNSRWKINKTR